MDVELVSPQEAVRRRKEYLRSISIEGMLERIEREAAEVLKTATGRTQERATESLLRCRLVRDKLAAGDWQNAVWNGMLLGFNWESVRNGWFSAREAERCLSVEQRRALEAARRLLKSQESVTADAIAAEMMKDDPYGDDPANLKANLSTIVKLKLLRSRRGRRGCYLLPGKG